MHACFFSMFGDLKGRLHTWEDVAKWFIGCKDFH